MEDHRMDRHSTQLTLGRTLITPGALSGVAPGDVASALRRHASGDWGDVCEADRQENDLSLREGFRIMSVYRDRHGVTFWIITEADRSATTVLLPDEY